MKKTTIEDRREVFLLPRGLTRAAAWELARVKCKHDHRGFVYDPKTGKAVCT